MSVSETGSRQRASYSGEARIATSGTPRNDDRPSDASGFRLYLQQVGALLLKDLLIELRTKDILLSSLVFGVLVLTVFAFAFELRAESVLLVSPGVLWVAVLFAGTLALGRAYSHERERGSLEGLLLCPMDRSAVYVAKFLTITVLLLLVCAVLLPVFSAFFSVSALNLPVVAVVLLGVIGFAAVGTVYGAMAVNTRAREVMLPVLLFPVLVPLVIAVVKATGLFMDGEPWVAARSWVNLLIGFDVLYLVVSFITFEFVIEDWG